MNSVHAVYSREFEKELAGAVHEALAAPGADSAAIYALVTQTVRRDVDYTPPAVHNALLQGLHPDTVIDPVKGTTVLHELVSRAYPPQLVGGYGGGEEEAGEDGTDGAAAAATGVAAEGVAEGVKAVDGGEAEAVATAAAASEGRDAVAAAPRTGGPCAAASSALASAINAALASATLAESAAPAATMGTPAAATVVPPAAGGSARDEGEESAGSGGTGGGISLRQFLDRGATPDLLDSGGNSALHLLLAGVASETMFPDASGAAVLQVRDVEDMFGDADRVHYLDTVGRALMQAGWSMDLPNRKGNTCAKLLQLCRSRLESKGARMVQHDSNMVGSETAQRLQKQLEHTEEVLDQLEAFGF